MHWFLAHQSHPYAVKLADRHYSRKKIGSKSIMPPGDNIVLVTLNGDALFAVNRPNPESGVKRQDGFDYWNNPYFRNESTLKASDLILEGMGVMLWIWGKDNLPLHGFHSFVNPRKVKPIPEHGTLIYGWVFKKAGFELYPELTKERKLLRWVYSSEKLLQIEPLEPEYFQRKLAI